MARKLQPRETDPFTIVDTINQLADGRSNNVSIHSATGGGVTLTPSASTTTVNFPTVSVSSMISLSPRTANAAAAVPTTFITTVLNGSFIISHANNTQTDRTFDFSAVGG